MFTVLIQPRLRQRQPVAGVLLISFSQLSKLTNLPARGDAGGLSEAGREIDSLTTAESVADGETPRAPAACGMRKKRKKLTAECPTSAGNGCFRWRGRLRPGCGSRIPLYAIFCHGARWQVIAPKPRVAHLHCMSNLTNATSCTKLCPLR